jgi:hypothetical protein
VLEPVIGGDGAFGVFHRVAPPLGQRHLYRRIPVPAPDRSADLLVRSRLLPDLALECFQGPPDWS